VILLAGARLIHFGAVAAAAIPLVWIAMVGSEYRRARLLAFFEGGSDLQGANYQVWQSLIALGDGGLLGKGLGHSAQKLRFLPEPFNDFIFSIVGEELGFIGAMAVLLILLAVVLRGFRIARSAGSAVGALLAAGISLTIGIYTLVNVGVVTSLVPATGLALPFISYGGSSLVISLAGAGLLLSVSRQVDLSADSGGRRILP
jgi:cell division protein FtsW